MLPKNPTKRRSRTSKLRLKAECDKLARQIVCFQGKCQACPDTHLTDLLHFPKFPECAGRIEWAHIKSRRFVALRHRVENAVSLCSAHHRYFHDHPDLFIKFIDAYYPGRLEMLNEVLRADGKVDYEEVRDYLKEELDRLLGVVSLPGGC